MGVIQKMASKHCKNRNKSDMNHDIIDDYEVDKIKKITMKKQLNKITKNKYCNQSNTMTFGAIINSTQTIFIAIIKLLFN